MLLVSIVGPCCWLCWNSNTSSNYCFTEKFNSVEGDVKVLHVRMKRQIKKKNVVVVVVCWGVCLFVCLFFLGGVLL